jgi:predicted MFS family arabinose efflux permease
MPANIKQGSSEWRANWTLVLAAAFGFSFSSIIPYSIGLFIDPLKKEFGWSSTTVTMGMMISAVGAVMFSPFVGAVIDRWGTRRLGLAGIAALICASCGFAFANGSVMQWAALWCFFALADLMAKSTVWTTAVAGTFDAQRSLAIAVTMCGASVAHIAAPVLSQTLIAHFGWRMAFALIGLCWGGMSLAVVFLLFFDAKDRFRNAEPLQAVEAAPELTGMSLQSALTNIPLIRIGLATFITLTLTMAVAVHQVPLLTEAGLTRANAAYLASLGGTAVFIGNLGTGRLMDRFEGGTVGAVTLLVSGMSFVLLYDGIRTVPLMVVAMLVIGYTAGAKMQICAYLTTRYAGMRNYGKIFGVMASLMALAGGLGPLLASLLRDHFGNYTALVTASVVGTIFSAVLIFRLGPYPDFPVSPTTGPGQRLPSGKVVTIAG